MSNSVIAAKGLTKYFYDPMKFQVLKNIELNINHGEFVSIVGKSGCGKSTLLYLLSTMDTDYEGEIYIHEQLVTGQKDVELARIRNEKIGFVFQFHHLLPEFSALENICIPGWIAGKKSSVLEKKALALMDRLGIAERSSHKPSALSGGEQQRVAVARALINDPGIVFADEPTGNLDSANATSLHQLFQQLRDELKQTFVIVTHNEELAAMSNRTVHLRDGRWAN